MGLGSVGLTTDIFLSRTGLPVAGIDTNRDRVNQIDAAADPAPVRRMGWPPEAVHLCSVDIPELDNGNDNLHKYAVGQ